MQFSATKQTAVVTGASGYVATELVKQLLSNGYTVRGTVRSTSDTNRTGFLTRLGEALPGRLELHAADLLQPGSFDGVCKGADVVFHTASPYIRGPVDDPQGTLVDPAVKGTRNVLQSAAKCKASVRRVVLTSSTAAVGALKTGPANGKHFDADHDWNIDATLEAAPYPLSKVEAERAAWAFSKEQGLDLVVINPCQVLGPMISERVDGVSIKLFRDVLEGNLAKLPLPHICDVRDIALAHIRAAELPDAEGRYIVAQGPVDSKQLLRTMHGLFPHIRFAQAEQDDYSSSPQRWCFDMSKTTAELGVAPTPVWQTFRDMAGCLLSLDMARPKLR